MPKQQKPMVVITISTEEIRELTLDELCSACEVTPDFVADVIEQGVIEPLPDLRFNEEALRKVRTVLRLQQDLEVNLPGAALIIDLMDELERLRKQLEILQR